MEMLKTLKDKVMGTDEQNKAAAERMKNNPMEKKFQKMMGNESKDEKEVKPVEKARGGKVKKFESGGDVYDNYERRSRINDAIRREGLAPYEIKELEMKKPKEKRDRSSFSPKGPSDSFNYEKAEKALADYRARMGSDAGGKTISSGSGGGGGIPKLNRDLTKNMKSGGKVTSASKRADGCAVRGKTRA
jgi:hypothetical protein